MRFSKKELKFIVSVLSWVVEYVDEPELWTVEDNVFAQNIVNKIESELGQYHNSL